MTGEQIYPIGSTFQLDREGTNACFGCGPQNPDGLRLEFTRLGVTTIENRKLLDPMFSSIDGLVHGGIITSLIDETSGVAAQMALEDPATQIVVTAELNIRFRRPVPIAEELVTRAELVRVDGPDLYVDATMRTISGDTDLAVASSRWRRLPTQTGS